MTTHPELPAVGDATSTRYLKVTRFFCRHPVKLGLLTAVALFWPSGYLPAALAIAGLYTLGFKDYRGVYFVLYWLLAWAAGAYYAHVALVLVLVLATKETERIYDNIVWLVLNTVYASTAHPRLPAPATIDRAARQRVSVIICNKNEERAILERCIESLHAAREHALNHLGERLAGIRIVLSDGESDAFDVQVLADRLDALHVIGNGKLTGRDGASRIEDCDIIVSADADTRYSVDSLTHLLAPLLDPEGPLCPASSSDDTSPRFELGTNLFRMNGALAAYWKALYLEQPFDLGVDQFRFREIFFEEEFVFLYRLALYGPLVNIGSGHYFEMRHIGTVGYLKREFGIRYANKSF